MNDTREISLFLYQSEIDLLAILPGTIEEQVEAGITFRLENPGVTPGVWGGKMPDRYPLRICIKKDLVVSLEKIRLAPETALRCWLNNINGDYIKKRRKLATAAKSQGEETSP